MNNPERLQQIENLFHAALEREPFEAAEFIAESCEDDAALRAEVESLLAVYNRSNDALSSPVTPLSAVEVAELVLKRPENWQPEGKQFGNYRILREIGRGGMGTVYLAERSDGQFKKQVAVKLLRRGMETGEVIRRFNKEKQILADLEHPNIARLLDGGTSQDNLPYFVMEYVEGLPVDRYCEVKKLSLRARLKLFREICAAVGFAHRHSIIHRDIKPKNILVCEDGTPKLLDFGIAKVLHPEQMMNTSETTATVFRAMTPDYASPEQMRGKRVTAAADIYSLGVLLYKLLTGMRPHNLEGKSPFEIAQAICEDEPVRPSLAVAGQSKEKQALTAGSERAKLLNRDLDNIILKALRKEPERRYASVAEFSEDIQRHLKGLPVKARKDTFFYHASKFFRRHRVSIMSSLAVAFVVLLAGYSLNLFSGRSAVVNESNNVKSLENMYRDFPVERKKGGTDNTEARNLYLKAQWLWEQRSTKSIKEAAELFRQAIEVDPEFALAYSGLSNSYFLLSVWGSKPAKEAFPPAKIASLKAIELAPEAAEGHLSLAMVYWLYEFDWKSADREFKKAVELNPDYARAPHWYGLFLAEMGRFDEAIATENRALSLEPQSLPVKADLARVLFYARRYDESFVQYQELLNTNTNFGAVYAELEQLYEAAGMEREWAALIQLSGGFDDPVIKEAYEMGGLTGYWRKKVELAEKAGKAKGYPMAVLYAKLNEKDRAFELLDKAIEVRAHEMAQIKVHPALDNLRSDPRFKELLRKMNFTD